MYMSFWASSVGLLLSPIKHENEYIVLEKYEWRMN